MKKLSIRDMRANVGQLDELVEAAGELLVTRHGKVIARVLPVAGRRHRPDHAELRLLTPRLQVPSSDLIRAERDER